MKIDIKIELVDERYRVTIGTHSFTAVEQELLAQFGEPLVEVGSVGGTTPITATVTRSDASEVTPSFTLPSEQRRLISDFPLIRVFDLNDDTDSDAKARVYADEIRDRIVAARDTLYSTSPEFISDSTLDL
jgi:hypothetical protein